MAHTYKSGFPAGVQVDDGIKSFFEEFYKTSDTPDAHEKYADSFTEDATLVMASKKGVGRHGKFLLALSLLVFCRSSKSPVDFGTYKLVPGGKFQPLLENKIEWAKMQRADS